MTPKDPLNETVELLSLLAEIMHNNGEQLKADNADKAQVKLHAQIGLRAAGLAVYWEREAKAKKAPPRKAKR